MCPVDGYFDTVFAVDGDLSSVPDATQSNGTVSYEQGFPVLYSTPVVSGGYNVPRASINQLFYDVTSALQQYQQNGAPSFITSAMNGGTAYSYSQGNIVRYSDTTYISLVNSNTDTPPSSKWSVFTGSLSNVDSLTGTNHTFSASDGGLMILRSNSGTVMVDMLPGTGTAVMPQGWQTTIVNNDSSALYQLTVASGADLDGSSTGSIVLGVGQRATVFSDGSNYYSIQKPIRTVLGANTTFYVSTTGSDTANNGLTSSTAWATIQNAVNYLLTSVDLRGFNATINLANGTYSYSSAQAVQVNGPFVGGGPENVIINGNSATPSNVIVSVTGFDAFQANNSGSGYTVENLEITIPSGSKSCLNTNGGNIYYKNIVFGSASGNHVNCTDGIIKATGNYSISGGAEAHFSVGTNGSISMNGITITLTGTPAFSTAFASATMTGTLVATGITFSGSATGSRYSANLNGAIETQGGGSSYFPGSTSGSTATGGQYA